CFFFQAEDGIRDKLVTGVQTCALPISLARARGAYSLYVFVFARVTRRSPCRGWRGRPRRTAPWSSRPGRGQSGWRGPWSCGPARSEERRVGKECGARGWGGGDEGEGAV